MVKSPMRAPSKDMVLAISGINFNFTTKKDRFVLSKRSNRRGNRPFNNKDNNNISVAPVTFLVIGSRKIGVIRLSRDARLCRGVLSLTPRTISGVRRVFGGGSKKANGRRDRPRDRGGSRCDNGGRSLSVWRGRIGFPERDWLFS